MNAEQLVRDVARLRRAHRRHPEDEDIAVVRLDLERAAGPTVGRAAAARLLGVSQTALDRWVAHGDVPVVLTPTGRREVPVAAVVDLLDALAQQPSDERHPLAAALRNRRTSVPRRARAAPAGHRAAEQRGLDYHRAVARRLDDEVVADALVRLRRWQQEGRIHPRYADAWEALLSGPRRRLRAAITADDDEAAALRQSSPLAGALGERERREALGLA
ncbi:MAG: hypothetical protein JSS99_05835 [Actinobacteria bacterium]|nr:hypothetical protein [Actinomycetota bacterium]